MRTAGSFVLGFVLAAPFAAAQEPDANGLQATVRQRVEEFRKEQGIPGISVAVGVAGEIPVAFGLGLADLENDVPATEHTVYRLASISKPITAICALRLHERGELDLDAPVHTLVSEWPKKRWPVTTRQLLGHLGGVRHYKRGEGESTSHFPDQTKGLVRFASDPLIHEPGTKYRYTTFGYNLAAAVVEAQAARPFPRVVREWIAEPSRAPSLQDDDVRRLIKHRAQGYRERGAVLENSQLMDGSYKLGGGGLCSSAPDLVRFGQALLADRLLQRETLELMWTEQRTAGGDGTGYGLGFRVGKRGGRRTIAHSGAQSRVSTMFLMLPDDGIVVALLCNLERRRLAGLANAVADLALATVR
ncbi:MAG: beta-lactamase family protein [bacterium]|nr:beta-lactamase family protein [bacterium]